MGGRGALTGDPENHFILHVPHARKRKGKAFTSYPFFSFTGMCSYPGEWEAQEGCCVWKGQLSGLLLPKCQFFPSLELRTCSHPLPILVPHCSSPASTKDWALFSTNKSRQKQNKKPTPKQTKNPNPLKTARRTGVRAKKVRVLVTQSCLTLCTPLDCVAHHSPLSMEFSRQGYWSGLPFPSPGDLPDPGVKPEPPALQTDSLLSEPSEGTSKPIP